MSQLHLGIAQLHPAWGNKTATVKIITDAMAQAAAHGIELLAFSETFLAGYPFWVCRTNGAACEDARQQRAFAQYLEAGVEITGPEIAELTQAASDLNISLYLGLSERGTRAGRGSIWCTLATIHARRGLIGAHRKLIPTHDERLSWGYGDARDLRCHEFGAFRVGGLNCWENWIPLARSALYQDGEDIHISTWPGNAAAVTHNLAQVVAHEGRVWSASIAGLLAMRDIPTDFEFHRDLIEAGHDTIFEGGSIIVSPQGETVASLAPGEAGITSHVLDMASVRRARQDFDVAGHYARPDIFSVAINRFRHGD